MGQLQPILGLMTAWSSVSQQLLWRWGAIIQGRALGTAATAQSASLPWIRDPPVQRILDLFLQWILDPSPVWPLPGPGRPSEPTIARCSRPVVLERILQPSLLPTHLPLQLSPLTAQLPLQLAQLPVQSTAQLCLQHLQPLRP